MRVEPHVWVVNMVAQRGVSVRGSQPLVNYKALESCLNALADEARLVRASVHMPRIGCGLGRGDWATIERLIDQTLHVRGINVYVYDLN